MIISVGLSSNQSTKRAPGIQDLSAAQSVAETIEIRRAASAGSASSRKKNRSDNLPVKPIRRMPTMPRKLRSRQRLGEAETSQSARSLSAGFPPVGPHGPVPRDRYKSGEVCIPPISSIQLSYSKAEHSATRSGDFTNLASSRIGSGPDDSRCPPPICNGLRVRADGSFGVDGQGHRGTPAG